MYYPSVYQNVGADKVKEFPRNNSLTFVLQKVALSSICKRLLAYENELFFLQCTRLTSYVGDNRFEIGDYQHVCSHSKG